MLEFLAGLLVGAAVAYYAGRRHGYVAGHEEGQANNAGFAKRKTDEAGWPLRADRDNYGQKIEK